MAPDLDPVAPGGDVSTSWVEDDQTARAPSDEGTRFAGTRGEIGFDPGQYLTGGYLVEGPEASGERTTRGAAVAVGSGQWSGTVADSRVGSDGITTTRQMQFGLDHGETVVGFGASARGPEDSEGQGRTMGGTAALRIGADGEVTGVDARAALSRGGRGLTVFGGFREDAYTVHDPRADAIGVGASSDGQLGAGGTMPVGPVKVSASGYMIRGETVEYSARPASIPGMEEAMAAGDMDEVNRLLAESRLADRLHGSGTGLGGDPIRGQDFSSWEVGDRMRHITRGGSGAAGGLEFRGLGAGVGTDELASRTVEYEMLEDGVLAVSVVEGDDEAISATLAGGPVELALKAAEGRAAGARFEVDLESDAGRARMDAFTDAGILPGALDLALAEGRLEDLPGLDLGAYVEAWNAARSDESPLSGPNWSDPGFVALVLEDPEARERLSAAAGELNAAFLAQPDAAPGVDGARYEDIVSSRRRESSTSISALGARLLSAFSSQEFTDRAYRVGDGMEMGLGFLQSDSWLFSSDEHTSYVGVNREDAAYLEVALSRGARPEEFEQVREAAVEGGLTEMYLQRGGEGDHVVNDRRMAFTMALSEQDVGRIDAALESDPGAAARRASWAGAVADRVLWNPLRLGIFDVARQQGDGTLAVDPQAAAAAISFGGASTLNERGSIERPGFAAMAVVNALMAGGGYTQEQALGFLADQWGRYEGEIDDFDLWALDEYVRIGNLGPDDLDEGGMSDLARSMFLSNTLAAYDGGVLGDRPASERFALIDVIWDFDDPETRDRHLRQLFYEVERQQDGGEAALEFHRFIQTLPPDLAEYLGQGMRTQITGDFGPALSATFNELLTEGSRGFRARFGGGLRFALTLDSLEGAAAEALVGEMADTDLSELREQWELVRPDEPFPYDGVTLVQAVVATLGPRDLPSYLNKVRGTDQWEATEAFLEARPAALFEGIPRPEEMIDALVDAGLDGEALYADYVAQQPDG